MFRGNRHWYLCFSILSSAKAKTKVLMDGIDTDQTSSLAVFDIYHPSVRSGLQEKKNSRLECGGV